MYKKIFDQAKFKKGFDYAYKLHFNQKRKDSKTPYIKHLLYVAIAIIENGGSTDESIAGLLHDSIEDQGGKNTYNDIKTLFGKKVANYVMGCSEIYSKPKPNWDIRKKKYIDKLKKTSKSILFISLCDKLHNLKSTVVDLDNEGLKVWKRFNAKSKDIFNFYQKLFYLYEKKLYLKKDLINEYKKNLLLLEKFVKKDQHIK